jgi:hypothetical protein
LERIGSLLTSMNHSSEGVMPIKEKEPAPPGCQDCEHDDTPLGTCADDWNGQWGSLHCLECCGHKDRFVLMR